MQKITIKTAMLGAWASVLFFFVMMSSPAAAAETRADLEKDAKIREIRAKKAVSDMNATLRNSGTLKKLYYDAVARSGELDGCKAVSEPAKCRSAVKATMDLRYFAEGRCDDMTHLEFQPLCRAIKAWDCDSVSGIDRDICLALRNRNFDRGWELITSKAALKTYQYDSPRSAQNDYAVFVGYLNIGSIEACRKIARKSKNLLDVLRCDVLFGQYPSDAAVDKIARELAVSHVAKQEGRKDFCDAIDNPYIKDDCLAKR